MKIKNKRNYAGSKSRHFGKLSGIKIYVKMICNETFVKLLKLKVIKLKVLNELLYKL